MGYLNIRGYWDVVAENRPTTQTAMVTLSFAPAAPEKPATPRGPRHLNRSAAGLGDHGDIALNPHVMSATSQLSVLSS